MIYLIVKFNILKISNLLLTQYTLLHLWLNHKMSTNRSQL